jgi:prolyl oligopeptidase
MQAPTGSGSLTGGTDWKTWRIRNVDTGEDLDDAVSRCKFTGASWSRDSEGFYYSRYPAREDGSGDGSKTTSVYYHRRGTVQEADEHVYTIPGDTEKNPYAFVTQDGRFLIVTIWQGYDANDVYYIPLPSSSGPTTMHPKVASWRSMSVVARPAAHAKSWPRPKKP